MLRYTLSTANDVPPSSYASRYAPANLSFGERGLYVNGVYDGSSSHKGSRFVLQLPTGFSKRGFAFSAEVMPESEAVQLVMFGTSWRWFGLRRRGEQLEVMFNNGDNTVLLPATVPNGKWTRIRCSVDLDARSVRLMLNDRTVAVRVPPEAWAWRVLDKEGGFDELFTTTNYSNGSTFKGWLRNVSIYGSALPPEDL